MRNRDCSDTLGDNPSGRSSGYPSGYPSGKGVSWRVRRNMAVVIGTSLIAVFAGAGAWSEDQPAAGATNAQVELARAKAVLLHDTYSATLDVIHERYFRNDRSAVPARALEDVFDMMARQSKIEARWIGVNARTMSINHEPKDDFEKSAVEAIRSGKEFFERIENGHLRRAGAIPLTAGCLTCHGTFGIESKSPRFAGLVIKVPLAEASGAAGAAEASPARGAK